MSGAPHELEAAEAVARIKAGTLTSTALVRDCLSRIEASDESIQAWAWLDPDQALAQAAEADRLRQRGYPLGRLHGVPVGLKDIIDTADMPTERGSKIFAGRRPDRDAAIVDRLREAGAVIMGKTVTTELAFLHPSRTRNPHDPGRSPGGSSSGSAAAVAAGHVPLAVGTQTNGSVIRPAAFCGTFGFKPTRGMIARPGLLQTSVSLDQIGSFGRSLRDVALLADVLAGHDSRDPLSLPRPRPEMEHGAQSEAPVPPDLAWFDLPFNDRLQPAARDGLEALMDLLDARLKRLQPAEQMAELVAVQSRIHLYEICQHLAETFDSHFDDLSPTLQPVVETGRKIGRDEYEDALAVKASAESFFSDFFLEFDAILAPSSAGEAPRFETGTGDPVFCTLWTLAGLPCVTLPLLVGEDGLPVGVQLIGPAERDDRLLRTARWLQLHIGGKDPAANDDETRHEPA